MATVMSPWIKAEKTVTAALYSVGQWVEEHEYKGYEPFDGLTSPLCPLLKNNRLAERILIQLVRQSPVNLRCLFGIKPTQSTPARGYMARGYLRMYQAAGKALQKEKAIQSLDAIVDLRSRNSAEYCWGNQFDFTSRGGQLPRFEGTIVWSSLIGLGFLDAFETLGNKRYLQIAESVCRWILNLPREQANGGVCLSYVSYKQESVHNSNMLGAAMLARTAHHSGDSVGKQLAKDAMQYSCSCQLPDGSWYYGEAANLHWIDSFHTGYNLESLKSYTDTTGDTSYEENLSRGFQYFKGTFFKKDGTPKYYHNRTYPIDIQCAAQAIDTFVTFSQYDKDALDMALKVAGWTIENMQDRSGYFYYRLLPFKKVKIPMLHWGQATMFKALSALILELSRGSSTKRVTGA
jgi:hypothetical protein